MNNFWNWWKGQRVVRKAEQPTAEAGPVIPFPPQRPKVTEMELAGLRSLPAHEAMWKSTLPDTTPSELRELAHHPAVGVRSRVASHHRTPPDVLQMLARQPEVQVRQQVAANRNTPFEALDILAKQEDAWVRMRVWRNTTYLAGVGRKQPEWQFPPRPPEIGQEEWFREYWLRHGMAENPSTAPLVLQALLPPAAQL